MKETDICSVCGESYPLNQLTGFSSQLLCPGCLGAETVLCTSYGEIILSTDTYYAGDSRDDSLCWGCCCQA